LILLPFGSDNIFFLEDLIYFRNRDMRIVFLFEEILDFLSATIHLPFSYLPNSSLRIESPTAHREAETAKAHRG